MKESISHALIRLDVVVLLNASEKWGRLFYWFSWQRPISHRIVVNLRWIYWNSDETGLHSWTISISIDDSGERFMSDHQVFSKWVGSSHGDVVILVTADPGEQNNADGRKRSTTISIVKLLLQCIACPKTSSYVCQPDYKYASGCPPLPPSSPYSLRVHSHHVSMSAVKK